MAAPWANMPLPSGWEARFDPGQRKYFFINHSTKTTSWDDPRQAVYHQQRQPQQPHVGFYGQQPARQPSPQPQREQIPMQKKCSKCNRNWVSGDNEKCTACTRADAAAAEVEAARRAEASRRQEQEANEEARMLEMVRKLKREFPRADSDIIIDILESVHNDYHAAKAKIHDLGLGAAPAQSAAKQPAASPSANKPSLTERQKTEMVNKFCSENPDKNRQLITFALESCNFDVNTAKRLIQTMPSMTAGRSPSRPTSSANKRRDGSSEGSTRPVTTTTNLFGDETSGGSPAPPTIDITQSLFPSTSSGGGGGGSAATSSKSPQKSGGGGKQPRAGGRQPAANRERKPASPKKKSISPSRRHAPAPTGSTFISHLRTPPVGPNPQLASGPDRSLLLKGYVSAVGPDLSLARGPNPDHLISDWIQQAGPTSALASGPNRGLVLGSNPNLVQGPTRVD